MRVLSTACNNLCAQNQWKRRGSLPELEDKEKSAGKEQGAESEGGRNSGRSGQKERLPEACRGTLPERIFVRSACERGRMGSSCGGDRRPSWPALRRRWLQQQARRGGQMSDEQYEAVDQYLAERYAPGDDALTAALAANDAARLPPIAVSATQGKLLQVLARMIDARRILEIGTLGGYSSLWLASALPPDGRLVTLELNARHAAVARSNFVRAGVADRIELREGPALESLAKIQAEGADSFDFFFIDADKPNSPNYLNWTLKLAHRGSVIVIDNVIRDGAIVNPGSRDPAVQGTRRLHDMIAAEPRLSATAIQTVGAKGYDGFTIALVTADP
jgi:predicted O-methyltransferase YrrM